LLDMYTASGLAANDLGNPAQAILWFATAADLAENDPQRRYVNLVRAHNWLHGVPGPVGMMPNDTTAIGGFPPQVHGLWTPLRILPGSGKRLQRILFDRSGDYLLTQDTDNKCMIWDLKNERPLTLSSEPNEIRAAAWSPDGKRLALAGSEGSVS